MESSDITKYTMEFVWPLIKEESGTAIIWTLIGGGLGLLISIFLIIFLWRFLKNRKFLGGKTGPKWPKYLLLVSWIILLPLSCVTGGGTWGLVTAAHKIAESQNAIEEAVSIACEQPINQALQQLQESPDLSPQQKALLIQQEGDEITVSAFQLSKWFIELEDSIYDAIKEQTFSFSDSSESNDDQSTSITEKFERWVIDSLLAEHNPASLAKEGKLLAEHAEKNFGTHVTAKELGYSTGAILVKPYVDKAVKGFKTSVITTTVIQVALTVLITIALAALLVWIVQKFTKNNTTANNQAD